MKTSTTLWCAVCVFAACSFNIHDNEVVVKDAKVSFTTDADLTNVQPGQQVPMNVTVQNVFLVEPNATPPPEHVNDAGHIQIYVDDTSSEPILITAQVSVSVTIPSGVSAGKHKMICRVHKHDGTPTTTRFEIDFTVKISGGAGGGSGGAGGGTGGGAGGGTGGGAGEVDAAVPDAGTGPTDGGA